MRILFMDNYFPGFFRLLVPYVIDKLGHDEKNEIVFLSEHKRRDFNLAKIRHISIRYPKVPSTYPIAEQITLNAVHQIEAFAHAMQQLKKGGFYPDIVIATEPCSTEVYNVFPHSCKIVYFDLYYNSLVDDILISKGKLLAEQKKPMYLKNSFQLASLLSCDLAIVPSKVQKESFPEIFHDKIEVLPLGIDVDFFSKQIIPEEMSDKIRPEFLSLLEHQELITYSARNPNEYAGFSTVCQAIPRILAARPKSHVVIVTHNVNLAKEHQDYAELIKSSGGRVHIFGQFTWNEYCVLLQKSAAHIYMSAKPSLPTSLLEAMSCGALIIASDTKPVRDIITHKQNGFLVDFFTPISLADTVVQALSLEKAEETKIRKMAREFALKNYAAQKLIPAQYKRIQDSYKNMVPEPLAHRKQL